MARVRIKDGTEGPRHDPYAYREVSVTGTAAGAVILHSGLGEWIKVNGVAVITEEPEEEFKRIVGIRPERLARRLAELPYRTHRTHCSGREFLAVRGYPGETFHVCNSCGCVVDASFNRAEVE